MIKIYATDTCPRCKILEEKLINKEFDYQIITDMAEMKRLHIMSVPWMDIGDGKLMDFATANNWINAQ